MANKMVMMMMMIPWHANDYDCN